MATSISRRSFLAAGAGAALCTAMPLLARPAEPAPDFPMVDFHAHISSLIPIEKALEISARRGVKFGIVEHAGKVDIMANPTFLPSVLAAEYDSLWTEDRMKKIIAAAVEHNVVIEINSRYRLPSLAFLKLAKKAGARFSFGSNIHDESVGTLDYCVEMAAELGLKSKDMFAPAPAGHKPIEIRKF